MLDYAIRRMRLTELKSIYERVKDDFVPGEYAPYDILYQQLQKGSQKGYILLNGEDEVAYSICAEASGNHHVLISLLAVFKEVRGNGFGAAFLDELQKLYSDKKGIIVEVEKPEDAENDEEKNIRERRIRFYQKMGFNLVPNIDYSIWDVPMHLMALPQLASSQIINENIGRIMYDIYFGLMGEPLIHKMKLVMLESQ